MSSARSTTTRSTASPPTNAISRKRSYLPNAPGGIFDKTSGNSIPGNVTFPSAGCSSPAISGLPAAVLLPDGQQRRPSAASTTRASSTSSRRRNRGMSTAVARWQFSPDHQAFLEAAWSQDGKSPPGFRRPPISAATIFDGEPCCSLPEFAVLPACVCAAVSASTVSRSTSPGAASSSVRALTKTRSSRRALSAGCRACWRAGTTRSTSTGRRASPPTSGRPVGCQESDPLSDPQQRCD